MPESDACVGLDVLDQFLVVVVGRRAVDVKLHECFTRQPGKLLMDLVEQPEFSDVLLLGPVGDHMEVDERLRPVFDALHDGMPLEGHKLDEHRRTIPCGLLLDKLDIAVPQVDVFYRPWMQFVIDIRVIGALIILSGGIDAQCLKPILDCVV